MQGYEYSVIAAPARGEKTRSAKTAGERYAAALARVLNEMAADGWDYVRAETLPSEERSGIASRTTVWTNVLVFRRALPATVARAEPPAEAAPPEAPRAIVPPVPPAPRPMPPVAEPAPAPAPQAAAPGRVFSEPMKLTERAE